MKRLVIMTVILTSMVMASCNVTRVVTNESKYTSRGDTAVKYTSLFGYTVAQKYVKPNFN